MGYSGLLHVDNYPNKAIRDAEKRLEAVKRVLVEKYTNPGIRILGLKKYKVKEVLIMTYVISPT